MDTIPPCKICGITKFCNRCDDPGECHKIVCAPTQGERVLKYSNFLKETFDSGILTLSQSCYMDYHTIRLFDNSNACGICGCYTVGYYENLDDKVEYNICKSCLKAKRMLCRNTGEEIQTCNDELITLANKMLIIREHFSRELLSELFNVTMVMSYSLLKCSPGTHYDDKK